MSRSVYDPDAAEQREYVAIRKSRCGGAFEEWQRQPEAREQAQVAKKDLVAPMRFCFAGMGEDAGMGSLDDPRDAGRVVRVAVGDKDGGELFRLSADGLDVAEYRSDVPGQSGVYQRQSLVLDQIGARPRDAWDGVDPVDYLQLARLQSRDVRSLASIAGLGKRRGPVEGNGNLLAAHHATSRPGAGILQYPPSAWPPPPHSWESGRWS